MLNFLKQLLPHELRQQLKRRLFFHQDMNSRLLNLRRAGFAPSGAIDGGAYQGDWTRTCWSVWPGCPAMMVEPLPSQLPILKSLAAQTKGSFVLPKAIGAQAGKVPFLLGETNSSIVSSGETPAGSVLLECVTLDEALEAVPQFKPNLLKLDLQGHELQALAGAARCRKSFEIIILEVSVLRIGDVPIFSEVDQFMEKANFRLYDVLPQYYRPRDGALWQMDVFYVRNDSRMIASRNWD